MGVLFLAGIYGVGKSTLGETLSQRQGIPFYSAGDLISQVNGEIYGANKIVADKVGNQYILAIQIERLLKQYDRILLAGHFCIVNKRGEVDCLPQDTFKKLHLNKIILLEAEEEQILDHLRSRDAKYYSPELVTALRQAEREMAYAVSTELNCPIATHCMTYSPTDASTIEQVL